MEYAIEQGLSDFDPGMGSEHKARRGFQSFLCSSMHRPFDRRMLQVFQSSLPAINAATVQSAAALDAELPFKAGTRRTTL
jgi:predicted N-acyltransferase